METFNSHITIIMVGGKERHWRIQGVREGSSPISLVLMQFSAKIRLGHPALGLVPSVWQILNLPLNMIRGSFIPECTMGSYQRGESRGRDYS